MRVAAIYDIHGNLPALEAVLEEISQAEVDGVGGPQTLRLHIGELARCSFATPEAAVEA
ncbi:MAG TPA: hypothetical protein VMF91_21585 [Bryobacteraceae bacterium]|nr:hypothetical protein [Bryobacteraceae bacterium]